MCECCNEARSAPESYRMFADYCLYCAARRIQYIQRRLPLVHAGRGDQALGVTRRKPRPDVVPDAIGNPHRQIEGLGVFGDRSMSANPYVSEWRESHLAEWREADLAERITLDAPELRPVGQVPCVPTSTGLLIGCAYRRPMPQRLDCMVEAQGLPA